MPPREYAARRAGIGQLIRPGLETGKTGRDADLAAGAEWSSAFGLDPPTRAELLSRPLRDAIGIWLCLTCLECPEPRLVAMPCKLLARRHGGGVIIRDTLKRLRCSACGGRRVRVEATDDPAAGAHGGKPVTWKVAIAEPDPRS